ncbi:MAG: TlpA disulfide reductase family protein [Thermodesulfobacteriota bacterium]
MSCTKKMVRWRCALGVLVFLAVVLMAGNVGAAKKMPDFSEKNITSEGVVDSKYFAGKVLLVNFWATWCPPCRKEIPALIRLQDEYKDKGFSVIGISMDEGGRKVVSKFIKKLKVNYPVFIGKAKIGRGFGGVMGIPVSFLVDRDGNLVKRLDGYISEKVLNRELKKLFE